MYYDYSVLVIAEPDFVHKAKDPQGCLERLKKFMLKRAGDSQLRMVTVEGRYGFPGLETKESDDRNKTVFVKGIEDYLTQLNEIVFLANYDADPYIEAVNLKATEAHKTTTVYSYEPKA